MTDEFSFDRRADTESGDPGAWDRRVGTIKTMARKLSLLILILLLGLIRGTGVGAQESPNLHVVVNMVQLNVAVTDKNGNYITGLRPQDFAIVEDGILEKAATFAEGNEPARSLSELAEQSPSAPAAGDPEKPSSDGGLSQSFAAQVSGANVFVLFDTSDY